jgi:type II secretory pathway pseudopilin PulG
MRTPALRIRRGLSIVELMISLTITSMLLSAIAAAYMSSSQVIENNDKFFRATQAARVALAQMLTEVRRCDSIPINTTLPPHVMITANELPISRPPDAPKQPNEDLRVYEYIPSESKVVLYFIYLDGSKSNKYPIASNVQAPPFQWDLGKDSNNADCVARVSIDLDIKVDKQSIRITGAAAPRRSMVFK